MIKTNKKTGFVEYTDEDAVKMQAKVSIFLLRIKRFLETKMPKEELAEMFHMDVEHLNRIIKAHKLDQ
jgi:hypothetical protein